MHYAKIRSTALWMLIGRGNLKGTDEENLPPSWILDTVTDGENTVVCKRKPKLQHLLMCHVTTQGMELRMQEGDAKIGFMPRLGKIITPTEIVRLRQLYIHSG